MSSQYTQQANGMFQANFATEAKPGFHFTFRRWRIEPFTSFEMPEEDTIRYKGRYLRPESFIDELTDDRKRGRR